MLDVKVVSDLFHRSLGVAEMACEIAPLVEQHESHVVDMVEPSAQTSLLLMHEPVAMKKNMKRDVFTTQAGRKDEKANSRNGAR